MSFVSFTIIYIPPFFPFIFHLFKRSTQHFAVAFVFIWRAQSLSTSKSWHADVKQSQINVSLVEEGNTNYHHLRLWWLWSCLPTAFLVSQPTVVVHYCLSENTNTLYHTHQTRVLMLSGFHTNTNHWGWLKLPQSLIVDHLSIASGID